MAKATGGILSGDSEDITQGQHTQLYKRLPERDAGELCGEVIMKKNKKWHITLTSHWMHWPTGPGPEPSPVHLFAAWDGELLMLLLPSC